MNEMVKFLWPRILVFVLTFAVIVGGLIILSNSSVFWNALNGRFAKDERYQLQTLFLPDRARDLPVLVIGDSQFVKDMPPTLAAQSQTRNIVVNQYDSDDLGLVIRGLRVGARFTQTRSCTLIVQVTPLFSLRAKALGPRQDYRLLRSVYSSETLQDHMEAFFGAIEHWAKTRPTMPASERAPKRPQRMIGQAQLASLSTENWDRAFADVAKYKGQIIAVLDTHGTDWGTESDLITATRSGLDALAAEHANFTWLPIEDASKLATTGCNT